MQQATARWHSEKETLPQAASLDALVLHLHRANFDLWHEEDKARDRSAADAEIVATKHAIDRINQTRNDTVEQIDGFLLSSLSGQNQAAPMNSETPGLILDRLSILALKIFHTAEEAARQDATEEHRNRNRGRLAMLQEQSADLTLCLQQLWDAVLAGERRFKLYRQLKMYNDPALNPFLYRAGREK
ncbi:MAG: DUF4254 domain-containing protein [Acidobacteria bacterium]|nr:DUF4254 domain-containing protein [Acidobacteriota bacterium]